MNWVPLHRSIVNSSIWQEPLHVCKAFLTIMSQTDQDGICPFKNAKVLASVAVITLDQAEDAMRVLSSPDKKAPGQVNEGRRIEFDPDVGIVVLQWLKYQVDGKRKAAREADRLRQAEHRKKKNQKLKGSALDYEPPPEEPVDEEPPLSPENQRMLDNLNRRPLP